MCLQDEGADIDVSTLLLPEPGVASGAALASREPELDADAAMMQPEHGLACKSAVLLAQPASASATALVTPPEESGALGAADADEPGKAFGDQLAEAGKVGVM